MKKINIIILCIIMTLICNYQVNAKDTLYSMNSFKEENFKFIEKSYNKENNQDGFIVAGEYLENEEDDDAKKDDNENYQAIIIKYNYEGKKIWDYSYGEDSKDSIESLTYSYSTEGKVDGYLLVVKETNKLEVQEKSSSFKAIFLKLDLNGKLVLKKEITLDGFNGLSKILPISNNDSTPNGYIAIATFTKDTDICSTIISFDNNLNIVWQKDQLPELGNDVIYEDMVRIYENNNVVGYAVIEQSGLKNQYDGKLLRFDLEGNKVLITDSLKKYTSYYLAEANNGFMLYGLTKEVKVEGGEYSYYLINYDSTNKEIQESVGDFSISDKENLKLLPISEEKKITGYLLFYGNASDSSKEVIKLDLEGLLEKKVKKISNEYYTINNFLTNGETLYFIGYITCPEEDNCDYDTHSLFLISDEDKVIEVKDNTAKNISLVGIIIISITVVIILIKKKLH